MLLFLQNDHLSTTVAVGTDLWFHADGVPGAHVILRSNVSSYQITDADRAFAADCAAYFSKARDLPHCRVVWTEAINVRKPKGAPAGTVELASRGTIVAR